MTEDDIHRIFEQPRRCVSIGGTAQKPTMESNDGNDTGIQV